MRDSIYRAVFVLVVSIPTVLLAEPDVYDLGVHVRSRTISFENPTGAKGSAGKAASSLGVGRKGSPAKHIQPGESIVLCDIEGPGVIRHIWLTVWPTVEALQGIVIRAFWDNQKHPSIEAPLGSFFGTMHGQPRAYQSAVHSVNARAGLNTWMEMPFRGHAKIVIQNESAHKALVFYNIDLTLGDKLPPELGYLHSAYRRENPTTLRKDFEVLPTRKGKGRYLGCVLGIRTLSSNWWGEGEFKVYLDGDEDFPTICGTGTEDYVGQSWGLQNAAFLYAGTCLQSNDLNTIYRWHIKDPIYWKKNIRATIQQIGYRDGLYERQDDWSVCSFWYEPIPSDPLPDMPNLKARLEGYLPEEKLTTKPMNALPFIEQPPSAVPAEAAAP